MRRGGIVRRAEWIARPVDPVYTNELWHRYGLSKTDAFRLWQSGQCKGQMYGGRLALSRGDVEKISTKESPGARPGMNFN
jgi:hypothetical protein